MRFLHPCIGLEDGWTGPGKYNWEQYDKYFAKLLELVPDAFLFPRLHTYAPDWWKKSHPEELITCGLPVPAGRAVGVSLIVTAGTRDSSRWTVHPA